MFMNLKCCLCIFFQYIFTFHHNIDIFNQLCETVSVLYSLYLNPDLITSSIIDP